MDDIFDKSSEKIKGSAVRVLKILKERQVYLLDRLDPLIAKGEGKSYAASSVTASSSSSSSGVGPTSSTSSLTFSPAASDKKAVHDVYMDLSLIHI